jgi:diguanylate cyclase (GGDEF)-like protein
VGYNDTYGHRAGDRTLQEIARAIQDTVKRPGDLVARYGGEEFVVILPRTDVEGAIHLAETICTVIRTLAIPHCKSQVSSYVTISAGVATEIPQLSSDFQKVIDAADWALYQAKTAGRDRFSQYIKSSSSTKLYPINNLFPELEAN